MFLSISAAAGAGARGGGAAYIGAARCRSCHADAYQKWKAGPHAKALLSLPIAKRRDPRCTSCHSPDPGGLEQGVQCETCHGGGRHYSFDFVMKDYRLSRWLGLKKVGERTCSQCHEKDGLKGRFNYPAKLRAIVHWPKR